jgi:MFS transporter, Spinster family, sphingosine-1-phosphate transporter
MQLQVVQDKQSEPSMALKTIPLTSYQLRLLAVLVLVNFVNFAARWVFIPLLPMLRADLGVTDAQLGSLQTWLLLVLAVGSIPFGFLADRLSRKAIIVFGIVCWSLATFAGGFAGSFMFLLIARAFVGIGEAAYAPAAQSMISGTFPLEKRASAQAIFASGMLLGGAAGEAFGGVIGSRYGWQYALFVIAAAGLIPVIAALSLQEPPRGPCSDACCPIRKILAVPAFLAMIAGGACITFSSVSLLTWGVDFAVTYKDFSLRQASVSLAVIGLVCGLCGVLFGGYVADRLQRRFTFGRIIAIAVAFLLSAPFLLLAIQTEEQTIVLAGLALAAFFMSWYHGPVTAVIHDMMPRRAHATSIGVYMLVTQLVGGFGPQLVGRISDLRDLQLGLQIAVAVMVCGGLLMFLVIHFIRRDGLHHQCLASFRAEPGD